MSVLVYPWSLHGPASAAVDPEPKRGTRGVCQNQGCLFLIAALLIVWGQIALSQTAPVIPFSDESDAAKRDLDNCHIHEVRSLPGSHHFGSDFIEATARDPNPRAIDRNVVWGLTADLSSKVPSRDRAMYISKSTNGGKTWSQVARVDSRYFDADIGEGERNGLSVFPGGTEFVITTQLGAFQVIPPSAMSDTVVRSIPGPRVVQPDTTVTIPKKVGDPVTANVVKITADGNRLIVGYGYFDLNPQLFTYRKGADGSWVRDGLLPRASDENGSPLHGIW